jgi:hypothetical protein
MRRLLTWLAGGLGAAALVRQLLRRQPVPTSTAPTASPAPPAVDPAEELRAKLEQARDTADDRDEFDAAEGTPVDTVDAVPAEELGAKMEQARDTADDPDELDAAEGTPVDTVDAVPAEEPSSLEERRRRVHDKAQDALGRMRGVDDD